MATTQHPKKQPFDISMSKRTRKPIFLQHHDHDQQDKDLELRKSLKQLIMNANTNEADTKKPLKIANGDDDHKESKRSSLGQHFNEEEKQLQLLRKEKVNGTVGRYVKILGQLIKIKRDKTRSAPKISNTGSKRKPLIFL